MPVLRKALVNFYSNLELPEDADEADIKKAYRALVLKWHPDKNPKNRAKAEERIREINTAYGTLSNPLKREKYDLQRWASDPSKKKKAPKAKATSKVTVPKEFMIQPLGHPDNFLRCNEKKTSVPLRQDLQHIKFKEFFEATKFSLWWVAASGADQNNECRIRALGSKAKHDRRGVTKGLAGGLNLSFKVVDDTESEVILAAADKGKRKENVDFIVKESPEFEGAFRFETACKRGHYLAFFPKSDLRVCPLLNETEGRVLDFMLTDFSATLRYKDLEEVLVPLAEKIRGAWIPLSQMRESPEVASYFSKVLKKPLWDVEDFAAYFEGHWTQWEYNAEEQLVRLRPIDEKLTKVLRSASSTTDAAEAILHAGEELSQLGLHGALQAIRLLGQAEEQTKAGEGTPDASRIERQKLLKALPTAIFAIKERDDKRRAEAAEQKTGAAAPAADGMEVDAETKTEAAAGAAEALQPLGGTQERALESTDKPAVRTPFEAEASDLEHVTIEELLSAAEGMFGLAGEFPSLGILKQRKAAVRALLELIATRLERSAAASTGEEATTKLQVEEVLRLLRLPGMADHDQALTKVCAAALQGADRPSLLKIVQRAVVVDCNGVAEMALIAALQSVNYLDADEGAAFIVSLARAGARPDRLAVALRSRATFMSPAALAKAIVALCDKKASSVVLQPIAERLAGKAPLTSLSSSTLVGLAVAAVTTESLGLVLDAVAKAVTSVAAAGWSVHDLLKVLLAFSSTKGQLRPEVLAAFMEAASGVIKPKLKSFEMTDLLKLTLAAASFGSTSLLEAAAKEVAVCMSDLALPQLLLLTQTLSQGLPPDHVVLQQLVGFWSDKLKAGGAYFHEVDNLVKLAVACTPTLKLRSAGELGELRERFAQALGNKLEGHVTELNQANRDLLEPEFKPEGAFGSCKRQAQLHEKLAHHIKVQKPKMKKSQQEGRETIMSRAEATRELKAAETAQNSANKEVNTPAQRQSKKRPLEKKGEEVNASENTKRGGTKKRRAIARRLGTADF